LTYAYTSQAYEKDVAISIRGVRVSTSAGKEILRGVNLDVYPRGVNTVVGPSGSGKSTLLKVLNRLVELEGLRVDGEVRFQGQDLLRANPYSVRKEIGMVFQTPNPFPMSIYENVAFGVNLHWKVDKKELDQIVESTLREVGLYEEVKGDLNRSALTLSGGQKQRLCMARALAVRPSVLLLDEPTSSLDPVSKEVIEGLITKLKSQLTVMLVTHDMAQASRVSDYVAVMRGGSVERWGAADEVLVDWKDGQVDEARGTGAGRFWRAPAQMRGHGNSARWWAGFGVYVSLLPSPNKCSEWGRLKR